MIELTPEQRHELRQTEPTALDPETKTSYVLVRKELYDRMQQLVSAVNDWSAGTYEAAMEVFARDGWDDPRMDVYDQLEPS